MASSILVDLFNQNFIEKFPKDAASYLEKVDKQEAAALLHTQANPVLERVLFFMTQENKARLFLALPDDKALALLKFMDTAACANLLARLTKEEQHYYLSKLTNNYSEQILDYMNFPENVAGSLMEKISHTYHDSLTTGEVLEKIRQQKLTPSLYLYLIDSNHKLSGRVNLQQLLTADDNQLLSSLSVKNPLAASFLTPKDEIASLFEKHKLDALPVVDSEEKIVGIIYASRFIESLKEEISSDIQTMVGASPDEKALSPSLFAVKRRLPWLFINLLTAFLAASVVGAFEGIIAKYTALAVLLPVVAGQSGNAGAQALAVTMRGLALREVSVHQWLKVVLKETGTGIISGLAIAIACSIAVYFWSHSLGLSAVLCLSMLLSVLIACISGALVPLVLKRLGQDPAQSSSIILTTVTDVAGFLSFLGIASLLSRFI